ncbi:MAG: hypothetical protein M1480_19345 [Bacteroidetes bacterium]|nr:hypothetical protein [Bacteroidota bacterium]
MKNKIISTIFILSMFMSPRIAFCQSTFDFVRDTVQSHYFLWFHGHWDNKKKNTFDIKPAFGTLGGGTATVENDGNVKVQTPTMDNWDKFFDQGLDDIYKWEQELKSTSHDYEEWSHHLNVELQPYLESMKNEWKEYKIKPEEKKVDLEKQRIKSISDSLDKSCSSFKPRFDEIMSYYKKHRHDGFADLVNPPPPEIDYTCSECDTNIEKRNKKIVDDYAKKFVEPEAGMIRDLIPRIRNMELLGVGQSYNLGDESGNGLLGLIIKDFYNKNGVCSYLHKDEMWKVVQFLANHVLERAEKLVEHNRKNFKTARALIEVYCSVARDNALLGNSPSNGEYFGYFQSMMMDQFYYYKHKLFGEHDWSQLSNFNIFFEFVRSYLLLGGDEKSSFAFEWTKLLAMLNDFQLSIEMTVNANGKAIVRLKGTAKVAPEFNPDSNKCYTWVVIKDKPSSDGSPILDKAGIVHCDLLQNTMPGLKYIGTHKYYTEIKQLKMDYCHPGQDTIMFTRFIPDPTGDGWWVDPYGHRFEMELNSLDSFFQDKSKAISEAGNLRQMASGIKSKGLNLAAQMKALESKMKSGGGLNGLTDIHKIQELANQSTALLNNQKIAAIFFIDFPLTSDNFTTTLVNKTYNLDEVDPMVARAAHGTTTIKIVYTGK